MVSSAWPVERRPLTTKAPQTVDQWMPVATVEGGPAVAAVKGLRVMAPSRPRRNRSPGRVPTREEGTSTPPARA
jgi:hypothetical protein